MNDPHQLVKILAQAQVTRIVLVPSLLRVLLNTYSDLQRHLPYLRFWVASGEALSVELCHDFSKSLSQSRLLNLYGSSEVAADVSWHEVISDIPLLHVPIGRPISNIQMYILDQELNSVPIGVPGELYVGGEGVARGYLNRANLTAERFVPNPFSSEPNARLYRTGDVSRYLPDGNIEFLGRVDHQVKLRGFRIELGEIEAILRQHPAVREAIVVTVGDTIEEIRMIAYVVAGANSVPASDVFQSFLRQQLPEYMIPAGVVLLDALPLTPNGKVDRRALAALASTRSELTTPYVAPRDDLERRLVTVCEELLHVQPIGVEDCLLDMGMHSIQALRLLVELEKIVKHTVSLDLLRRAATIAQIARILSSAESLPFPQEQGVVFRRRSRRSRSRQSGGGEAEKMAATYFKSSKIPHQIAVSVCCRNNPVEMGMSYALG